jgi:hypothetical protein
MEFSFEGDVRINKSCIANKFDNNYHIDVLHFTFSKLTTSVFKGITAVRTGEKVLSILI